MALPRGRKMYESSDIFHLNEELNRFLTRRSLHMKMQVASDLKAEMFNY
jgi:hypothetical protein